VIARGPNSFFVYPEGALNAPGTESLIAPHQGEYFSVSRFREVKAEFPEIRGSGAIHDIEVLIMSLEGQLIFYEKFAAAEPPSQGKSSRSAAPPSEPAQSSSDAEPPVTQAASPAGSAAAGAPAAAKPAVKPALAKPAAPKAPAALPKSDPSELIEPGVDP
jgi:hypothetical protein